VLTNGLFLEWLAEHLLMRILFATKKCGNKYTLFKYYNKEHQKFITLYFFKEFVIG
jgi:hypothetical protein